MDEEMWLEHALYPWLDEPSYDEGGDYDDPPEQDEDDEEEDDEEDDPERDADFLLERQELEDFEQADEYFGDSAADMF